MSSVPATQKEWRVQGQNGNDSLILNEQAPVPKLGDKDVLVKFHAASLNYRDLIIPRGMYPFALKDGVVPASDGAGEVVAVGPRVTRFKQGDRVATLFNQAHIAGSLDNVSVGTGVGGVVDGCLRQYGAFDQEGLVHVPKNLNWLEASTLSCAALTAWNGLYGLEGRALKPGDWVITQGTGGVSMFALQFAKSAGAKVIATTSSKEKADKLKKLGADHVINYKEVANWGEQAKQLTGGRGVDFVIEVGGPKTMAQSLKSIRIDGIIAIIGFVGGQQQEQPTFLDCLSNLCTVRGLLVGSRAQFDDMNRAIEANDIHPIVDDQVFSLEQTKEAYQYMWDQKHFGKLTIKIA
ncbi:putative alcohol dehydrogenase protein [Lasiodiplodia theobromae]|uniref:Alcohol dehydrogenase protein n=1 Tax=Lasiodiplodia theobromae TaxID=45133 RepID=A0A5N5D8N8_9PEZI|nr:Zinc-type alcohol dehydrogenase-like protein [Lasiodiplodia theobromae]KAF9631033.1 putative alcohol dehydrogenase protein [Lasiodiplodia theobromae]